MRKPPLAADGGGRHPVQRMRIKRTNGFRSQATAACALGILLCALHGASEPAAEPAEAKASSMGFSDGLWRRQSLADQGVMPFAVWAHEFWGNTSGGLQRGVWWNTLLDFGLELDTTAMGWWEGGGWMAEVYWIQNSRNDTPFAAYTGAANPVSGLMAGDALRVYNLHYRHAWPGVGLDLKMGQIAADDDFMLSDYAALFLNSSFGAMPSQVGTPLAAYLGNPSAFPVFPVAAPGVFIRWRPASQVSTQLGVYHGMPGADARTNHGFDWIEQADPGLGLFWESTLSYQLHDKSAALRIGLSYHTGPVDDFSGTENTGIYPVTRQTAPSVYVIHDWTLLQNNTGQAAVACFARAGLSTQHDRSVVAYYADAGLNWFAPLPGRSEDVAGIALATTWFSRHFSDSIGIEAGQAVETTIELTYRAAVTHWLALQADFQLLLNPLANPDPDRHDPAAVLGLHAEITF